MDSQNAFVGQKGKPSEEQLSSALGTSAGVWKQLVEELARDYGVDLQEWSSFSAKYGWSLKLNCKKRTIVRLAPCEGSFLVLFILGARAIKAAQQANLPKSIAKALRDAPRHAEGTGIRISVKGIRDLGAIHKLVAIKLAN
jgi:Protein of unknown function (DUF3788)